MLEIKEEQTKEQITKKKLNKECEQQEEETL